MYKSIEINRQQTVLSKYYFKVDCVSKSMKLVCVSSMWVCCCTSHGDKLRFGLMHGDASCLLSSSRSQMVSLQTQRIIPSCRSLGNCDERKKAFLLMKLWTQNILCRQFENFVIGNSCSYATICIIWYTRKFLSNCLVDSELSKCKKCAKCAFCRSLKRKLYWHHLCIIYSCATDSFLYLT